MKVDTKQLIVYLPDTRGVTVSRYGKGNMKIGPGVYTYSRLPGERRGTCPGASPHCEAVCYAKRVSGPVRSIWELNSHDDAVPPIPEDATLLRLHISGDFDTVPYIMNWYLRLVGRPDVTCWAYTRSWRVPSLLPALETLRSLPNMQLFASMDKSIPEAPPAGWRVSWIEGDERADAAVSYLCPEQSGNKVNCQNCRYCFDGQKHDVTFREH